MTTQCNHGFELLGESVNMCELELNHAEYHMTTINLSPHGFRQGRIHWSDDDEQDFIEVTPEED